MRKYKHNQPAFTLIELLVVISIIALLMAIALPATSLARGLAKRMACESNLRSIGWAFRMYVDDNRTLMPPATMMPSAHVDNKPSITTFLKTYTRNPEVFRCPADKGIQYPDQGKTYFEVEGSSYWYNDLLGGLPISSSRAAQRGDKETNIEVMYDYEKFHGPAGKVGSKSYLYADGHVGNVRN